MESKKQIEAQIKILESLKTDFDDTREGLGGTYGDTYVSTTQIKGKISSLKKKLNTKKK